MLTKDEIIEILREQVPYLASAYGVQRIGLFGSYAKDEQTADSDVDVVAEFEKPIGFEFVEFVEYLERILGKKVDVLTRSGIQSIRVARIVKDIEENIVYV